MPVRIGRVSSRDAERATFATVSTNGGGGHRDAWSSASGSGSGGKSSARSVRMWKRRRAGDDLDVLLGGPQLERDVAAGQRRDDVEQQPGGQHDRALAARPRPRAGRAGRSPCRWRAARPRAVGATSWTPDSACTALRVEATRVTVCSWASSVLRRGGRSSR